MYNDIFTNTKKLNIQLQAPFLVTTSLFWRRGSILTEEGAHACVLVTEGLDSWEDVEGAVDALLAVRVSVVVVRTRGSGSGGIHEICNLRVNPAEGASLGTE